VKAGTISTVVAAVLIAAACGHTQKAPRSRLTPKEIVQTTKPAIVRIEVGADRVGTGFVIGKEGMIATNLHVVVASDDIQVTLLDGSKYPVKRVIAFDKDHDLALLDIDPPGELPVLPLGDSGAISAGDPVLAIGNPLGVLDYTVSDGLLSAVRVLSPTFTLLQITAPISQGSSGGPLFNSYGEVIGIVNAFLGGGQNLNFAIPSNYLKLLSATAKPPMSMVAFKDLTASLVEGGGEGKKPDDPNEEKIVRQIPTYDTKVLDGCSKEELIAVAEGISSAIQLGAPLYNQGDYDACFMVYEGVSIKFQKNSPCAGVRTALETGLTRASALKTAKAKAWALRDAFDSLIDERADGVIRRKLKQIIDQESSAGAGAGAKSK
jgi:serine protease Do